MSESIVIIDSSDDEKNEKEPPAKKMKEEYANSITNENNSLGIKIVGVTSQAGVNPEYEVIEIDDEENECEKKIPKSDIKITNNKVCNSKTPNKSTDIKVIDLDCDDEKECEIMDSNKDKIVIAGDKNVNDGSEKLKNDVKVENGENRDKTLNHMLNNSTIVDNNIETPNVSDSPVLTFEFQDFLESCLSASEIPKYREAMENKTSSIKKKFLEADPEYIKSKDFIKMVQKLTEQVKLKPKTALYHFKQVYEELKSRKNSNNINLTDKQEYYLKRLRKTMKILKKRITQLEESEVDWDDDNNSNYIQMARYRKKFVDVHKKYCSYTQEDVYAHRLSHRKLDFSASKYTEINRALDKLYLKNKKFPTYSDVENCIRKCVKDKGLQIEENSLNSEIKKMFTEMGVLIQRRRRCELEDINVDFLGTNIDPAIDNPVLRSILDEQAKIGNKKMEDVFQKFTDRQMQGDNPAVSSDSDDSNIQSDDEDNESVNTSCVITSSK